MASFDGMRQQLTLGSAFEEGTSALFTASGLSDRQGGEEKDEAFTSQGNECRNGCIFSFDNPAIGRMS